MQTLEYLIDLELLKLIQTFKLEEKFKHVSNFITDDNKSAEFIRSILDDDPFIHPDEQSPIYDVAKARSRHSALTFLIGLVFKKFGGLYDSFERTTIGGGKNINLKLWMMTALSHDKGYYSERLKKDVPAHLQKFTHTLLTDEYMDDFRTLRWYSNDIQNVLAYTYADIDIYDMAALDFHTSRGDPERVDHGILGGCIVFDDYLNKLKKTQFTVIEKELYIIKTCALTIAQHNMFKSSTPEHDKNFPNKPSILQCSSEFRISKKTPLLLFLSLIDTFECIKKFSKEENDAHVETLTVLKKIKLHVDDYAITVDYSELFDHIKRKKNNNLNQSQQSYLNSIITLSDWTILKTTPISKTETYKITIN